MGFLQGKKILITGMISDRSIAYGIAKACRDQGADLAFTFAVDKLEDRVRNLAAEFDSELVFHCDVASDDEIRRRLAGLRHVLRHLRHAPGGWDVELAGILVQAAGEQREE